MRYFLDTEYDGFGGTLLSLALVPEDGGEEFYVIIADQAVTDPWVERHVVPHLLHVPEALKTPAQSRRDATLSLAHWLTREYEMQDLVSYPEKTGALRLIADWPEDIAHVCMLLLTGPGKIVPVPPLTFEFLSLPGFSTAANSAVPHNALHDARALRDHVMNHLE